MSYSVMLNCIFPHSFDNWNFSQSYATRRSSNMSNIAVTWSPSWHLFSKTKTKTEISTTICSLNLKYDRKYTILTYKNSTFELARVPTKYFCLLVDSVLCVRQVWKLIRREWYCAVYIVFADGMRRRHMEHQTSAYVQVKVGKGRTDVQLLL